MRTKILIFLALCAINLNSAISQVSSWSFDTDAKDAVGKLSLFANDKGISFVSDDTRGKVVEFDGSNGYLGAATKIFSYDALTLNVWFKWDVAASVWWVRIFDFGKLSSPDPGNHDVNYLTTFAFEDKLRWVIHSMEAAGGIDTILMSKAKIDVKKWYMVTCVHADSAKLYLNGELQSAKGIGFKPSKLSYDVCYFGKSTWPDPLFKGRMDEMTLYNKKLTDKEIKDLYAVKPATGIRQPKENDKINIYTQHNLVNISSPRNSLISVFDLMGRKVKEFKSNSEQNIIELKQGLYIIRVNGININFTKKISVK